MGTGGSKCCGPLGGAPAVVVPKDPLTVTIAGVNGQIGYALLPMLAKGDFFGPHQRVIIQGLDLGLPAVTSSMNATMCELFDSNFPLLDKVVMTSNEEEAFKNADYAILLGSWPPQESSSKKEVMDKNVMIFRAMGKALDLQAKKSCKVAIFAPPASSNAIICSHFAPSLPPCNFSAVTRLLHNRALGMISERAKASVGDVRNVIVWGGACTAPAGSTSHFIDTEQCTVAGRPLTQVLKDAEDRKWLDRNFQSEVLHRGAEITKARKASAAMSAARAVCEHVHDLHCGTRQGEYVSMGIWTEKHHFAEVSPGLYASMPVICQPGGQIIVPSSMTLSKNAKDKLKVAVAELEAEKKLATDCFPKRAR